MAQIFNHETLSTRIRAIPKDEKVTGWRQTVVALLMDLVDSSSEAESLQLHNDMHIAYMYWRCRLGQVTDVWPDWGWPNYHKD